MNAEDKAERAAEHLALYEEHQEAESFNFTRDLIAKTRYFWIHENERLVATAANRLCYIRSDYSKQNRFSGAVR